MLGTKGLNNDNTVFVSDCTRVPPNFDTSNPPVEFSFP